MVKAFTLLLSWHWAGKQNLTTPHRRAGFSPFTEERFEERLPFPGISGQQSFPEEGV